MDLSGRDIGTVKIVNVEDEMRGAYLDYAMSVITSRALPDARDGLKPVQRRILYAMHQTGLRSNAPYSKSAATVGEVMKHFHPHGDSAIYDALVRMAQPFSMRYPLIDGQGNFGSVDDDPPAAMRYTEARMTALAEQVLADIEKNTVNFQPNYDSKTQEPTVLPSRVPNLLVNGASGIAVGMATNIPPHNLAEVCDGLIYLADHPEATVEDLMKFIKGPDFPTAGIIMGLDGIKSAYSTGHGRIVCQARAHFEELDRGRFQIVVTELPYQVNKAALQAKIADLVRSKKEGFEGITEVRDESDRHGMRVVIELRRDAQPRAVLNNLYKYTAMRQSFSVNALALVNGQPRVLTLKLALQNFLQFRQEVVTRRAQYELEKARERAHILEGLKVALDHLDAVIRLIRGAESAEAARTGLMERFKLTEVQAQAILDMQLRRLAALERQKILDELTEILQTIKGLEELLASPAKILGVIKDELRELKQKFGDARRTIISEREAGNFTEEDLIPEQSCVISITARGYIKRVPTDTYRTQRRGTRGLTGMVTRESDTVRHLLVASTHDHLLFFTNRGRVFQLRTHEIPESSRTSKGVPVINLISIEPNEVVTAVVVRAADSAGKFLTLITRLGEIKKTAAEEFAAVRSSGLIAMDIEDGDELVFAKIASNEDTVLLVSKRGQAIRFPVRDLRSASRQSGGVRAMRLAKDDEIAGAGVAVHGRELLIVTKQGLGKRTPVEQFPTHNRGGQGVRALNVTERTGPIAAARVVDVSHEVMFISAQGIVVRMPIATISRQGRAARGVTVMRVQPGDEVVAMAIVEPNDRGPNGGPGKKDGSDDPLTGQPMLFADDQDTEPDPDEDETLDEATDEPAEKPDRTMNATRSRSGGIVRVAKADSDAAETAAEGSTPAKRGRTRKAATAEAQEVPAMTTLPAKPRRGRSTANGAASADSAEIAVVPTEGSADTSSAEPVALEATAAPKRAARKRASATAAAEAEPQQVETAEAPSAKPKRTRKKVEAAEAASPDEASAEATPTKRARSRATIRADATETAAEVASPATAEGAVEGTPSSEPARTTKRRKAAAAATPEVIEPVAEVAVAVVAESPNAEQTTRRTKKRTTAKTDEPAVAEVESTPKRRTTRRTKAAAEASPDVEPAQATASPTEPSPTSTTPRRRSTLQRQESTEQAVAPIAALDAAVPTAEAAAEAPAKPKRSTRRKVAVESAEPQATTEAQVVAQVESVTSEAKRKPAPQPQPVETSVSAAPVDGAEATTASTGRRRTRRKPKAEADLAESAAMPEALSAAATSDQAEVAAAIEEATLSEDVVTEQPQTTGRSRRRRRPNRRGPTAMPPGGNQDKYRSQPNQGPRSGGKPAGQQRPSGGPQGRNRSGPRGSSGYGDPGYGQRGSSLYPGLGSYLGSKHSNLPTSGTRPITRLAPQRSSYPGISGLGSWPGYGSQRPGARPGAPGSAKGSGSGRTSGNGNRGNRGQGGGRPTNNGNQGYEGKGGRRRPRNKR